MPGESMMFISGRD